MAGARFSPGISGADAYGRPLLGATPPPPPLEELLRLSGGGEGGGGALDDPPAGGLPAGASDWSLPTPPLAPPPLPAPAPFVSPQSADGASGDLRLLCDAVCRNLCPKEGTLIPQDHRNSSISYGHEVSYGKTITLQNDSIQENNVSDNPMRPPCSRSKMKDAVSTCSSSSDSSEDEKGSKNRKRKRNSSKKLVHFMRMLIKQVTDKQASMQRQLMEVIENMEADRIKREESWREKQMELIKRDMDLRANERLLATSHHLALISYLEKISGQKIDFPNISSPSAHLNELDGDVETETKDDGSDPSCTRWPTPEVMALVRLRAAVEHKFQSSAVKGSLWQDISATMSSLGYNRSAKKCKEKWENINKYYKRTIGSTRKRPRNSKSCPYFVELDMLYKQGVLNRGNLFERNGDDQGCTISS